MAQQDHAQTKRLRVGGISATIWPKDVTRNGRKWQDYKIRIQKHYMDEPSGEWKTTTYFRLDDMPKLALVANKVYECIQLRMETQSPESDDHVKVGGNA